MNNFFKTLIGMGKVVIAFLLIQMYVEQWIEYYRNKNWLGFILMSIIPALALYTLVFELYDGKPPPGFDNPYMDYDNR